MIKKYERLILPGCTEMKQRKIIIKHEKRIKTNNGESRADLSMIFGFEWSSLNEKNADSTF